MGQSPCWWIKWQWAKPGVYTSIECFSFVLFCGSGCADFYQWLNFYLKSVLLLLTWLLVFPKTYVGILFHEQWKKLEEHPWRPMLPTIPSLKHYIITILFLRSVCSAKSYHSCIQWHTMAWHRCAKWRHDRSRDILKLTPTPDTLC